MKDLIIPVNNEAHSRALVAVVGEDNAQAVLRAYRAIDSAMVFGYERGLKEAADAQAVKDMEKASIFTPEEGASRKAWADGYDDGYTTAHAERDDCDQQNERNDQQASYDDGYIDGVSDARVSPSEADRIVAGLCSDDEVDDYDDEADEDGFDGEYDDVSCAGWWNDQSDSGDENDFYIEGPINGG